MATVRINTSDTGWIARHAAEDDVIPYGTDVRGVMHFQAEVKVAGVEHVKFAGVSMVRFDIGDDWPLDHTRWAMYPESYLVDDGEPHDEDCACAGHGVCDYWNTVQSGPRAE